MKPIVFIDSEIDPNSSTIIDLGAVKDNGAAFHSNSVRDFTAFIKGTTFICGHNIIDHDLKFLHRSLRDAGITTYSNIIDTLFFSPLLFPTKPYHNLVKDDKLQPGQTNNPRNDAINAKDLLYDEIAAFSEIDETLRQIFYQLLKSKNEFAGFFNFLDYRPGTSNIEQLIKTKFHHHICHSADLSKMIAEQPIELAYCLALINAHHRYSITPRWVLKKYPNIERAMFNLRNNQCLTGCPYCNEALDIKKGLKKYFGFDSYRTYAGEPLQEQAVQAAVNNKSILAVFPTGGGKSITFQVPALMAGEAQKGLTVVISPLQSLMKDQIDNLEKLNITDAVTINGLLDPIERAKSMERVADGSASLLYISPESLRSGTIEHLLLSRKIVRFVIDEAHCFSSWGQDFRVDYLYIGDFIKSLLKKKNIEEPIPVSCFTATARRKVIEDICAYFKEKLSTNLEVFNSSSGRTNLQYKVIAEEDEESKYNAMRDLIEDKNCPTIVYVSRTRKAFLLAERLTRDGFKAMPYHGKMITKDKTDNQNAFIAGEVQIMVATSAFGMGVDKKDVGMVIHYEISDSLENYIQEAGRAGRDENIQADCFVLFNEEDLSKHFIMLNQTKLSIKEIQQIWKAIKEITRFRSSVSNSALEIARKAGWDDNVMEIETRVITAIAALEDAGYLKRGQNMPKIFANSIQAKTAQEAIEKINASLKFNEKQKEKATRIIKQLFSSKSKRLATEESAESRVDFIADNLGIVKEEVINIVNILREEKILADSKDLNAFIKRGDNTNRSLRIVEAFTQIEKFLLSAFDATQKHFHIKELNEEAEKNGCKDVSPNRIKTIINFWAIKNWIKRHSEAQSKNHIVVVCTQSKELLQEKMEKRQELAKFIVNYLFNENNMGPQKEEAKDEYLVEFSVHELKDGYEKRQNLFKKTISIEDIEDALFFLSRIEAIKIEGGFLLVYNRLSINRIEQDNYKRYTNDNYQKLNQFYENKVQQIHIVGEYAKKMIEDYKTALQFAEDYFQLNYGSFIRKYFPGSKQDDLKRNLTPAKFRQLFGSLSSTQLSIINDKEANYMAVVAGPGSGKTKVLVHKLASLLLMEDVKHEQLLMVTFSRAAATEFKKRLIELIGNAAHYIEIKTFHSYCFDLLGKVGNIEKSETILKTTIEKIKNGDVETNRITKTVLVIDEAQDMNADEFDLINVLMNRNEDMRVIAVGDDDQNIFEFRGASSRYLESFINDKKALKRELLENYRSKKNIVAYANEFAKGITHRLKDHPIVAKQQDDGNIKIVHYQHANLINPLVKALLGTELTGTTCVLTKTNDEASLITGLLLKNKTHAKLIQSNETFNLRDLQEIRFFLDQLDAAQDVIVINDERWQQAENALRTRFHRSSRLDICLNLIREFNSSNTKKRYRSDLEVFVRESKLEDFYSSNGETIFVSTIHKAKGREFDNVFIMLEDVDAGNDETKRQLYVAMTRAKNNLTFHLNGNYLDHIIVDNLERVENSDIHLAPDFLVMHLTLKDVWLDYFISRKHLVEQLMSGDQLLVNGDECTNIKGQSILKFSKNFMQAIDLKKQRGYKIKEARVNFIIYWQKEGGDQETMVVLPELHFTK